MGALPTGEPIRTTFVLLVVVLLALPASAHTRDELDAWKVDWVTRADWSLSPPLLQEWRDMAELHPSYFNPPAPHTHSSSRTWSGNVEQWRSLVSVYWGSDTDRALCLMGYESGGNPNAKNPRSSARGLFQILASGWAPYFGVSYEDLYNPETNIRLARKIYEIQGWGAWNPYKRGLCR